jgi:hypothetical protein
MLTDNPRPVENPAPTGEEPEQPPPRGLNLEETLWVLRNVEHPICERSPEVLAEFERLMQLVEEEEEDDEAPRDASSNLDDYIYG